MTTSSRRYRDKATEYGERGRNTDLINEIMEYRGIARRFTEWAENEEAADRRSRQPPERGRPEAPPVPEEERILLCLGGAVVVTWERLPEEVQQELSTLAASLRDRLQTTPLRAQIARYLNEGADDEGEGRS
jgi:hypothetical protein